jgi:UDP-N-acetylmuramate dehydrogenase
MHQLGQLLEARFGRSRVQLSEPLARYANWRVGGPADLLFIARRRDELIEAVALARRANTPITILGYGANVLISDEGIRGLVIINRAEHVEFQDGLVEVDSGVNLVSLARRALEEGVGGLEFLIGIPGTVGGAIVGNAGTKVDWIGHRVEEVALLNSNGLVQRLSASDMEFNYRTSRAKRTGEIVLGARLRTEKTERSLIEQRMKDFLAERKNQPSGPSTGSVFKNPDGDYAGRLIEACGLKGRRIGGAKISEVHANFIINDNQAKAQDIHGLIKSAQTAVKERFGIVLEEEVRYLGEWNS